MRKRDCLLHLLLTLAALVWDTFAFIGLGLRSKSALMAENLFLRKQLALYLERQVKPRRANDATRLTMVFCFQTVSLEGGSGQLQAENFPPLAPAGVPPVVAMEVPTPRSAPDSSGSPKADRGHGQGQSHLG